MTVQEYRAAGFTELSGLIAQEAIDRAERDVMQAYIEPLLAGVDITTNATAKDALMNLAVLCYMQRSIFATRSGAKEKTTPQSQSAGRGAILQQSSATCAMKLRAFALSAGVEHHERLVTDICGIYFRSHYLYI